jgi:poly(A) polymerase
VKLSGDWLRRPRTQAVLRMLTDAGHQALAVGGCVRNEVMGLPASDVDIATDALPETVMALAQAAGLKAVPTGIAHGTVTVVSGGEGYEVTTFRRDVETDGRRAVVAFSDRIEDDARRRDFTMNALYAAADGTLSDPLSGLEDALRGRVRFIEDAGQRIAEDHLRILRFFRFLAWYGDPAAGPDAEALAACAAAVEGLDRLSRERVGAEMLKLLSAPDPAPAVASLAAIGGLARVLPGADPRGLAPLVHLEAGLAADAIRRLAALGGDASDLRLSRADSRRLAGIRAAFESGESPAVLAWRHGAETARDALLLRAALGGIPQDPSAEPEIRRGAAAEFPVRAADLPGLEGAALGRRLKALERRWTESDLRLTCDDLLA